MLSPTHVGFQLQPAKWAVLVGYTHLPFSPRVLYITALVTAPPKEMGAKGTGEIILTVPLTESASALGSAECRVDLEALLALESHSMRGGPATIHQPAHRRWSLQIFLNALDEMFH